MKLQSPGSLLAALALCVATGLLAPTAAWAQRSAGDGVRLSSPGVAVETVEASSPPQKKKKSKRSKKSAEARKSASADGYTETELSPRKSSSKSKKKSSKASKSGTGAAADATAQSGDKLAAAPGKGSEKPSKRKREAERQAAKKAEAERVARESAPRAPREGWAGSASDSLPPRSSIPPRTITPKPEKNEAMWDSFCSPQARAAGTCPGSADTGARRPQGATPGPMSPASPTNPPAPAPHQGWSNTR